MTIKEKVVDLEAAVNEMYNHYINQHKELEKYAGQSLTDEMVPVVNDILKNIQDTFGQIYPFFHFINYRYPQALQATQHYNEFIDNLKKNGAKASQN